MANGHIVGGSNYIALHATWLTVRIQVMKRLIDIMRDSGNPGYGNDGMNSFNKVKTRMYERYADKYAGKRGDAQFTPQAVLDAVRVLDITKSSIVHDEVATPPEPATVVYDFIHGLCPSYIVAARITIGHANIVDTYKSVFSKFVHAGFNLVNKVKTRMYERYAEFFGT